MEKIKLYEEFIQEMALTDYRVRKILKHLEEVEDAENEDELSRCKKILTGDEDADHEDIITSLQDMGYSDIQEVEKEIFTNEK